MGKKTIKKNYEVEERLLALILMVDNFVFESSASLPEEVRRYTFDYLNKLKEYAGIEEKKYIDWDITDIKYNVEYEFEKNNYFILGNFISCLFLCLKGGIIY